MKVGLAIHWEGHSSVQSQIWSHLAEDAADEPLHVLIFTTGVTTCLRILWDQNFIPVLLKRIDALMP